LTEYLIGTGGWAYFRVPGLQPLVAYSRLFNFVEVNSTFYEIPDLKSVESWRRMVPPDFEFSVRCNKAVTHKHQFQLNEEAFDAFRKMIMICKTLKAEILHVQTPSLFAPNSANADLVRSFLASESSDDIRIAFEVRGANQALSSDFVKLMRDYNMIHSVDLSNDEEPVYESNMLYSRLFGRGEHNIYQPTDQELKKIDDRALAKEYRKVMVSFHFVRMYKDAARLKIFKQTGRFPMATKSTGFKSLQEILGEDARFPALKQELIQHQGWKLIDLTKDERVRASEILQKLPEKTYKDVQEVIQAWKGVESR